MTFSRFETLFFFDSFGPKFLKTFPRFPGSFDPEPWLFWMLSPSEWILEGSELSSTKSKLTD